MKPVRVSDDFFEWMCRMSGKYMTVKWGDPDAQGFYEPEFTEHDPLHLIEVLLNPAAFSEDEHRRVVGIASRLVDR